MSCFETFPFWHKRKPRLITFQREKETAQAGQGLHPDVSGFLVKITYFYKGLQSPVTAVLCPIAINEAPRESVNCEWTSHQSKHGQLKIPQSPNHTFQLLKLYFSSKKLALV